YCDGACDYPLGACMNATNHAMIQLVVSSFALFEPAILTVYHLCLSLSLSPLPSQSCYNSIFLSSSLSLPLSFFSPLFFIAHGTLIFIVICPSLLAYHCPSSRPPSLHLIRFQTRGPGRGEQQQQQQQRRAFQWGYLHSYLLFCSYWYYLSLYCCSVLSCCSICDAIACMENTPKKLYTWQNKVELN